MNYEKQLREISRAVYSHIQVQNKLKLELYQVLWVFNCPYYVVSDNGRLYVRLQNSVFESVEIGMFYPENINSTSEVYAVIGSYVDKYESE